MLHVSDNKSRVIYSYYTGFVYMAAIAQVNIAAVHVFLVVTSPAIIICDITWTIAYIDICMPGEF